MPGTSTEFVGKVKSSSGKYKSPRKSFQVGDCVSSVSTDPEEEQEASLIYNYLIREGKPVCYIAIAIEVDLKIPLVKRALKKLEEDNLVTLHDEKEESWKALPIANFLGELADLASQPKTSEELTPSNTLTSTPMPKLSINLTSPTCQFGEISEPIMPSEENLILYPVDFPVQAHPTLENGKDSNIPNQPYGEKVSASSLNVVPDSLLLSNLKEWSDEDLELFLPPYIWQDTLSRLQQFEHQTWVQDTNENDFLLFPTLTSGDKGSSRSVGQTKCDRWFKTNGLIPLGSQLSAPVMALMMGFPPSWFKVLHTEELPPDSNPKISALPTAPQAGLEADTLQDEAVPQPKQPSLSDEFCTWTPSVGDRVKLKRKVWDYPKLAIGTVTTLLSSAIHVRMDQDGGICHVTKVDLFFLGDKQLSFPSLCPECDQELISYQDGCGVCGWQGTPVEVNDYTSPKQKGIVLKDLGDKFEVALNSGVVTVYSKLYVYPDLASDELPSGYPLEKKRQRKPASGTLYSYIAHRKNKKGVSKEYTYWAYSYDVKVDGKWKSKKKSVPKWAKQRLKDAIAQQRGVEYILEILGGKR